MIINTDGFSDQDFENLSKKMGDLLKIEGSLIHELKLDISLIGGEARVDVRSGSTKRDRELLESVSQGSFLHLRGPFIFLAYESGDEFHFTQYDGEWDGLIDEFKELRLEDNLDVVRFGDVHTWYRRNFVCVECVGQDGVRKVSVSLPGQTLVDVVELVFSAMSRKLAFTVYFADGDGSHFIEVKRKGGTFLKY